MSRIAAKPELLFASPVIPSLTGNGLAMRAGMVLEALAEGFSVSLLVVELYAGPETRISPELKRFCRRVQVVQLRKWHARAAFRLSRYHWTRFDIIHVFRVVTLPFVQPFLKRREKPSLHLDLDDIESETHARVSRLRRSLGDIPRALFEESEARRCRTAEDKAFQDADRIYLCSTLDLERIEKRRQTAACVLPNAVRFPGPIALAPVDCFRFLFIATLGYFPNEDAATYLCREIIPRIRAIARCLVGFDIVGGGASPALHELARQAGAELVGAVATVESSYASTSAVVVPLRAGGGTRIKIIEAFSYRRPVISTSIGAEGLDARHEKEILIADTPDSFAAACVRMMTDADLRDRLTRNAYELARSSYSIEAMRRALA